MYNPWWVCAFQPIGMDSCHHGSQREDHAPVCWNQDSRLAFFGIAKRYLRKFQRGEDDRRVCNPEGDHNSYRYHGDAVVGMGIDSDRGGVRRIPSRRLHQPLPSPVQPRPFRQETCGDEERAKPRNRNRNNISFGGLQD